MLNVRNLVAGIACVAVFLLVKPLEVSAAPKDRRIKMGHPQTPTDSERSVQKRAGWSSIGIDRGVRFFACEKEIQKALVEVQEERAQGQLGDEDINEGLLAMNAKAWYLMQCPVAGSA